MSKSISQFVLILCYFLLSGCSNEEYISTDYGTLKITDKNSSIVVSAPHGTYDINTDVIAGNVCDKLDVNCIITTGFVPEGTRINVNRPTEGVGIKSSEEPITGRAETTYKKYLSAISNVTDDDLTWYFEIHGSRVTGMEIALHNLSKMQAKAIKSILQSEWSSYSSEKASIKVEGVDRIKMTGRAVKRYGIVNELQPKFVQFEFSRKLRDNQNLLSKFLVGSIDRITKEL